MGKGILVERNFNFSIMLISSKRKRKIRCKEDKMLTVTDFRWWRYACEMLFFVLFYTLKF